MSKKEDILKKPENKGALIELLYQLADDDFILAYRGSEWLGLAPHIEEDVAFSSISQDTMGHAAMYYQLLEELGEGDADKLAHARAANERRNAILLEKVNGPGTYLQEPLYDWAFAVVRNYFYAQAKKIRIDALKTSSYQPLADVAVKVNMELYYHLLHWKTWFFQLIHANEEANRRMTAAIDQVCREFDGVLNLGPEKEKMVELELIDDEKILKQRWINEMKIGFESAGISLPDLQMESGNGRAGEHSKDLEDALLTLSEVYRTDPQAAW